MTDNPYLLARHRALFERGNVENLWQELAEQFYPERADFTVERTEGDDLTSRLFDSTPVLFRRDLGNAFSAMLRPRSQAWFRADLEYPDVPRTREVRAFFDHVTEVTRRAVYARSAQMAAATKQADMDYATFGNAVLSVEANRQRNGLSFHCYHLKDCAWAENADGEVDVIHRRFSLTARQMAQMFAQPGDELPKEVKQSLEGYGKADTNRTPEKKCKMIHVVMPAREYEFKTRKVRSRSAPWASVYMTDAGHIVRESVSRHFRYVVPRWQRMQGSVYAVSPAAMTALPDARMMQRVAQLMLEAAEKQVDPPLKAIQGAVIGEVNTEASGLTWLEHDYDQRTGDPLVPMELGKNVRLGVDLLERIAGHLNEAFYLSKLRLPQRDRRTAYETAQLVEEFIREAIPLFEPLETEYNAPLLDMVAGILMDNDAYDLRLMPREAAGQNMIWAFSNPLHAAIEKNKVFQYEATVNMLAMGVQLEPGMRSDTDLRTAYRDALGGMGVPALWLREKDEADAMVEQEAQQREMQQAAQMAQQAGDAAASVGGAVNQMTPQGEAQ